MSAKFMTIRRGDHWWLTVVSRGRTIWLYRQARVGDRFDARGGRNRNL